MYEISKDYLRTLLKESGFKPNTMKHDAMVGIIELLDMNACEGLIASIKEDYEAAKNAVQKAENLKYVIDALGREVQTLREQRDRTITELLDVKNKRDAVLRELSEMQHEVLIKGCLPEEESRLRAYKAALEMGMKAAGNPTCGTLLEQVIRSASNVAANWPCVGKPEEKSTQSETGRAKCKRS
jgi:hypothetical protein